MACLEAALGYQVRRQQGLYTGIRTQGFVFKAHTFKQQARISKDFIPEFTQEMYTMHISHVTDCRIVSQEDVLHNP